MNLSVVIPVWSGSDELVEMTFDLCKKVKFMCDELIVSEDGTPQPILKKIASKYLTHSRLGHAKNLAEGIKVATGDFIALIDSDMEILDGDLRDLCIPGHVVSPSSVQKRFDEVAGWFLVSPKEFLIELLPYDQASQALHEGIDVWTRDFHALHKDHFVSSDKLIVNHRNGQSYNSLFKRIREEADSQPRKEIDPHRHRQRMNEEEAYRKEWEKDES